MSKLSNIFLICLSIWYLSQELQADNAISQQPADSKHQIRNIPIITDIRAFILSNPNLALLHLNKKTPINRSQSVKYSMGSRLSGDSMVAQYADTQFYPALKNVSIQVNYPATGTGSLITFVDINCLQDNNDGNAFVVAGGIGQRFISIVLEAPNTERFSYNMHVYGKD